jgi:hypothetical protein
MTPTKKRLSNKKNAVAKHLFSATKKYFFISVNKTVKMNVIITLTFEAENFGLKSNVY